MRRGTRHSDVPNTHENCWRVGKGTQRERANEERGGEEGILSLKNKAQVRCCCAWLIRHLAPWSSQEPLQFTRRQEQILSFLMPVPKPSLYQQTYTALQKQSELSLQSEKQAQLTHGFCITIVKQLLFYFWLSLWKLQTNMNRCFKSF